MQPIKIGRENYSILWLVRMDVLSGKTMHFNYSGEINLTFGK
jgi:hypothetical protein